MDLNKIAQIMGDIAKVKHPAIDLSLTDLGIVRDVEPNGDRVDLLFAFPFANIPIADKLVNSVRDVVERYGAEFHYQIVVMNDVERAEFMKLEASAWKGEGGSCSGCS